MKPYLNKVLIVGAGGVASYLLPALLKSFDIKDLHIMDGDKLEERNLDRQLFAASSVGDYKAEALCNLNYSKNTAITPLNVYLKSPAQIKDGYDVVIACVDNHPARRICLEYSDLFDVPVILTGNEYFDSQVMLYLGSQWRGGDADPRVNFPEILTDMSGDPTSCQGEEQEIHPQLAIANMSAASLALDMLWRLFVLAPEVQEVPWLFEIHKTRNNYEFSHKEYYEVCHS
jgi:molybdopterin/thiamine biosynthesis adenylyltransferase